MTLTREREKLSIDLTEDTILLLFEIKRVVLDLFEPADVSNFRR